MIVTFDLPGKPLGWARAGTRDGRFYTPTPNVKHAAAVRECYGRAAGRWLGFGTRPLSVSMTFTFSWPTRTDVHVPAGKPDLDNCAKQILDALNRTKPTKRAPHGEGAYEDDGQIVELYVRKVYAAAASTHVVIRDYDPDVPSPI